MVNTASRLVNVTSSHVVGCWRYGQCYRLLSWLLIRFGSVIKVVTITSHRCHCRWAIVTIVINNVVTLLSWFVNGFNLVITVNAVGYYRYGHHCCFTMATMVWSLVSSLLLPLMLPLRSACYHYHYHWRLLRLLAITVVIGYWSSLTVCIVTVNWWLASLLLLLLGYWLAWLLVITGHSPSNNNVTTTIVINNVNQQHNNSRLPHRLN